ncbi:TackOD1 domain-containing metal-binding protein [Halopelagius inordinatus]|uniref:TackOD1 domain-containing metal-binding protein n=1 Tax=Halopelagius inordinatus TaxID=553467 RepID=UPI0015A69979|nr:hypothetical protein [Halopelagius inordinatus]
MSRQSRRTSSSTRVVSCPDCETGAVERTGVFEHLSCGYVDVAAAFGDTPPAPGRCPKCTERLSLGGDGVPRVATVYRCADCDRRFDSPESVRIERTPPRPGATGVVANER